MSSRALWFVVSLLVVVSIGIEGFAQAPSSPSSDVVFTSGVDLVNLNVTVLDTNGQFIHGLGVQDFTVTEDGQRQAIVQFSNARVPVSLGIVFDVSASMSGEKMELAKRALYSSLSDLFSSGDEFFLYQVSDRPALLQDWTADRSTVTRVLERVVTGGNTALFDAVGETLPHLELGHNAKKALVIISDGGDNRSKTSPKDLEIRIQRSGAVVFALGIDCNKRAQLPPAPAPRHQTFPTPLPMAIPRCANPVEAGDLHDLTDSSGGRTIVVTNPTAVDSAISTIADELSTQYLLGYSSPHGKDGRKHSVRVETTHSAYRVLARSGYVAN